MEHIERALQRAKQDRQRARPAQLYSSPALNGRALNSARPPQSRVASLDPSLLESHRVIVGQTQGALTDVYRSLRSHVLQALGQRRKTTLGVTSANHGEGKTLTAINLAIAMAMDVNQTVLLVDADLRTPAVARCLGLQPAVGLSDYLIGEAEIPDCLLRSQVERLAILPARSNVGNSAELLASPRMLQLAGELKARYPDRIVIYDLPPLLACGDAIGFLPSVETTLLVIRDGATRTTDLTHAMELLADRTLIGVVLNAAA